MADFRIAKSCANCKQRRNRTGNTIECALHNQEINMRTICEFYQLTENGRILSAERNLLQAIRRDDMKFLDLRQVFR